jgi:hypothetical protein
MAQVQREKAERRQNGPAGTAVVLHPAMAVGALDASRRVAVEDP